MSNWEDLASRLDGIYTVDDFETAAYRLVAEQVIYHSDRSSRVPDPSFLICARVR